MYYVTEGGNTIVAVGENWLGTSMDLTGVRSRVCAMLYKRLLFGL